MNALFKFFAANFDREEQAYAREYGCAKSAIPGLIYYAETCAIYKKFKEEIWSLVNEHGGPAALLDEDDFRHPDCFENAMVWRAFEIFSAMNVMGRAGLRKKGGRSTLEQ